jgi:hypothetical protein
MNITGSTAVKRHLVLVHSFRVVHVFVDTQTMVAHYGNITFSNTAFHYCIMTRIVFAIKSQSRLLTLFQCNVLVKKPFCVVSFLDMSHCQQLGYVIVKHGDITATNWHD